MAGFAGYESGSRGGNNGACHLKARPAAAGGGAGNSPLLHITLRHTSRLSKLVMIAGINKIVAPNAYMPIPGFTLASCAILVKATRTPSMTTSSIDHT